MKPKARHAKATSRERVPWAGGFTLVELLIVITVIAVLVALSFPFLRNVKSKAQGAQSMHRIRQCGTIVVEKAIENNNFLLIHTSGTSSNMHDLRLHGMVKDAVGKDGVAKLVYTPAYERKASGTWPVWGANQDDNPAMGIAWERVWLERGGEQRYVEALRLGGGGAMERYPLLADSSNAIGVPRARFANDGEHKFAMRYGGKGPAFFMDGSTRLIGPGEMATFGITRAYLFKGGSTSSPTLVSATVETE